MSELNKENQYWLDSHLWRVTGNDMNASDVEKKLLEMQQRITELEQDRDELSVVLNQVLRIAQYPPMDKAILNAIGKDRQQSLAQHDKEVAIKAIEDFSQNISGCEDVTIGKTITSFAHYRDEYLEQLKGN